MADDKKPGGPPKSGGAGKPGGSKPPAPQPAGWHPVEIFIILFLIISVVGALVTNIGHYINDSQLTFYGIPFSSIGSFLRGSSIFFKVISFVFSGAAVVGIVVLSQLEGKVVMEMKESLGISAGEHKSGGSNLPENDPIKNKWQEIMQAAESTEEAKWRLAIIEADVVLDNLLKTLNLPGDTMGDKLKAVEPSDFLTLDQAWEAHKIRNNIAHGGSGFLLNQREARRVISLYEAVFKEFHLV